LADPASVEGDRAQQRVAFERTYDELEMRIRRFVALDIEGLDREALQRRLDALGNAVSV